MSHNIDSHNLHISLIYIYFNICICYKTTQREKAQREAADKAKQTTAPPPQQQLPAATPHPPSSPPVDVIQDDDNDDIPVVVTPPAQLRSGRSPTPAGRSSGSRGRGRPCKQPQPPSTDDKPVNASKAEMLRWQKKFNTAKRRYEILTSKDAEAYRQQENERVKRTRQASHQEIIAAAEGKSKVYQHIPKTPHSRAKEKSRQR